MGRGDWLGNGEHVAEDGRVPDERAFVDAEFDILRDQDDRAVFEPELCILCHC